MINQSTTDEQSADNQPSRLTVLVAALSDNQVSVVWNAARDLARMGPRASQAIHALQDKLGDKDATSVLWCRYALTCITGNLDEHLEPIINAIDDKGRVFPGMASAAIAAIGPPAAKAIPHLIIELADANPDNRWSAAGALARMGEAAACAESSLCRSMLDADEKTRWYSAWALGEIGFLSDSSLDVLEHALDDIDDNVRGYAARAIGNQGALAHRCLPALHSLAEDENQELAQTVQTAIDQISSGTRISL